MLQFFRKYQKFFFLFTTIVIVISFVFFGTFQVLMPTHNPLKEKAFTDLNRRGIARLHLEQMVQFLALEGAEKNLFNDGVIERDFLRSGLGQCLFTHYAEDCREDFRIRLQKEKTFCPYVHPQVPDLSAVKIWKDFAPDMIANLEILQKAEDPLSQEAFAARTHLCLAEKRFPGTLLKQFLFYQSRDYEDCPPDLTLYRSDLALFGYRDLVDWFGPDFMHLAATVIFNGAAFAEKNGYKVSRDEVIADLMYRSAQVDAEQKRGQSRNPTLQQKDTQTLYQETLARMHMNEDDIVFLWQKILLFRRLFADVDAATWIDTSMMHDFFDYAGEYATIELYQLPPAFCFSTTAQWQEFETYLDCVAKRKTDTQEMLPRKLESLEKIAKRAPELVQEKITVMMASVETKELEAKVSLKQMWDWEVASTNWELLIARFPELAAQDANTIEKRHALLDGLEEKIRAHIDAFARAKIVEKHPEWLGEAIANAEQVKRSFYLRGKQKRSPIEGIKDIQALLDVLEENDAEKLSCYTQDEKTYFRLSLEKKGEKSLLSFVESSKEGVLSDLLEKRLRSHYLQIREHQAAYFKNAQGNWKSFKECREHVAKNLFAPLEKQLSRFEDKVIAKTRFIPHVALKKEQINHDPSSEEEAELEWKVDKKTVTITRTSPGLVKLEDLEGLEEGSLSEVLVDSSIGPYFYRLIEKRKDVFLPLENVFQAKEFLGNEAKGHLFEFLLIRSDEEGATCQS